MRPTSALLPLGFVLIMGQLSSGSAYAIYDVIRCERLTLSTQGFAYKSHAESWFPRRLHISSGAFKHVSDDLQLLRFTKTVRSTKGNIYSQYHNLFPDGRLSVSLSGRNGYKGTGASYYKCNKTALEIRQDRVGHLK